MHILFLDESGTAPRPQDKRPNYFVVGGVIIPETAWHRMRDGLMGIKIRRKIRGEIKWRYFAPSNNDAMNPMRGMPTEERDAIRKEIYGLLASETAVRTLACVGSRQAAYDMSSVNSQDDFYHGTYKPVTERFQYHLQDLSRLTGTKQFGVVVGDHRGSGDDKRLRQHHEKLLHSSSEFTSKYENLVEGLFIHPSNLSVGIQLADMVAGAVWRKFEKNDERFYNLLEPSMRRRSTGEVEGFGLVKYPRSGFI
ncbi:MAG: DUF3800 domain-containing protein [Phenylobacterium sp.]|nr:DUF3800 domain-containing protein [Phenylobacterium sp.]MCA6240321.1 DUF3800 domain-containing protein [Phenylobacterium sp.]